MKSFLFIFIGIISFIDISRAESAKIFRVRLVEDLGTLDWNYGELNSEIVYQIMEGLFSTDEKGNPIPAVVKSFVWRENKTKLEILLKKKKWSDGKDLCAQDFVRSWDRLKSKEFASPYAHYANNLKSYAAKDCYNLNIEFVRSSPEALAFLSHYVFFPIREDMKKIFTQPELLPVNGPFKVRKYIKSQKTILEKNSNYVGAVAALDRVEFLFIPEDNTAKILFDRNEIDWMKDVALVLRSKELESSDEFRVFPSFSTYYYGLNEKSSKLLENRDLRLALSEALDRKQIPLVLGKENIGVSQWIAKELLPKYKQKKLSFDRQKAKNLLLESQKNGSFDLELKIYDKQVQKNLAEWAQGQWEKKLGIRIPIRVQEGKVYWKEISTNPGSIHVSGITAPYGHPRAYFQEFLSDSSANWSSFRSAEYDHAVNDERFSKAEDILQESGFIIPLYSKSVVALVKKKWKGFFINPLGQAFLSRVR